jgi:hypothetical protein
MLGIPDVLGALWVNQQHIYIDQTLDPDERPGALGRFRFTLAHEIGHWSLHRSLFRLKDLQDDLFQKFPEPSIICRTSQQRLKVSELKGRRWAFLAAAAALGRGCFGSDVPSQQNDVIEMMIQPLAEAFEVSRPAMRIRLEQLGFIVHDVDPTIPMFEDG